MRGITGPQEITDQTQLAKLALESNNWHDRYDAVIKLSDQEALAEVALGDEESSIRRAAVRRLTDQASLTRIAIADTSSDIRMAARDRIADPALKDRLASPIGRAELISQLQDSDPLLTKIATGWSGISSDARICIARMKLAVQEPPIQLRFPGLRFLVEISETRQSYENYRHTEGRSLQGESIIFRFRHNGNTLAESRWRTIFPSSTTEIFEFRFADVNGGELLKKLFQLSAFTPEDLDELCRSIIPEVRFGAVGNLKDQALLGKIAIEDKELEVCLAAVEKLTDEAVLTKIEVNHNSQEVRNAVKNRFSTLRLKR